jgi:dihydrolipoamide dehydrogenase
MQERYNLVVIGAGPGGYVAAIKAAQAGLRVAVVEERDVGGTCLNRGCVPTKALMHATHLYREMTMCGKLGIFADNISIDIEKMYDRKDEVVAQLRGGVEFLLKSNKIEVLRGKGTIVGKETVRVSNEEGSLDIETDKILIATGSVPAVPPIEGLKLPGVITSDGMLEQSGTNYKNLVVIGGGVIGVEFATVFSSIGCKVTVIEAMDRILPTMDKEIAQNLNMILKKRGVDIHAGAMVEKVVKEDGNLVCHFTKKGKEQTVAAEAVLVAIGRRANIEGIFGEGISVACERGIIVNEHFQTEIPNIYAIGDVIHGGIQLAHVASAQGCNAVAHMTGAEPEIDLNVVPSCIYTDPEISAVGITAEQAKDRGIEIKTGKFSLAGNCKSVIEGQERSFIKVIFDAQTEVILGAQLMCARATDLISELSTAIVNKLTIKQLSSVIRPHPTFTEAVTEAVEDALGHAVHIVPKK